MALGRNGLHVVGAETSNQRTEAMPQPGTSEAYLGGNDHGFIHSVLPRSTVAP